MLDSASSNRKDCVTIELTRVSDLQDWSHLWRCPRLLRPVTRMGFGLQVKISLYQDGTRGTDLVLYWPPKNHPGLCRDDSLARSGRA